MWNTRHGNHCGIFLLLIFILVTQGQSQTDVSWPETDNMRLSDGKDTFEGRLEVFHNGEWGTVCDFNWTDVDAVAVCRQLGFDSGQPQERAAFGEGVGKVWIHEVECLAEHKTLKECHKNPPSADGYSCSHNMDVGVICENDVSQMGVILGVVGIVSMVSVCVIALLVCFKIRESRRRQVHRGRRRSSGDTTCMPERDGGVSCTERWRLFNNSSSPDYASNSTRPDAANGDLRGQNGIPQPPPYSPREGQPEGPTVEAGEAPPPYTAEDSSSAESNPPPEVTDSPAHQPPAYDAIYQSS